MFPSSESTPRPRDKASFASFFGMSRGMQGLAIRLAKGLNSLSGRRGPVLADRYHAHVLASRRETARAVKDVLGNYRHHTHEHLPAQWDDPLSSGRYLRSAPVEDAPVTLPRTWLLRVGWQFEMKRG